jgi:hypothetical protein
LTPAAERNKTFTSVVLSPFSMLLRNIFVIDYSLM